METKTQVFLIYSVVCSRSPELCMSLQRMGWGNFQHAVGSKPWLHRINGIVKFSLLFISLTSQFTYELQQLISFQFLLLILGDERKNSGRGFSFYFSFEVVKEKEKGCRRVAGISLRPNPICSSFHLLTYDASKVDTCKRRFVIKDRYIWQTTPQFLPVP